jgi:ketosteroid isomerase-like protein
VGLGKIIKGVSEAFELPIGDHRDVTNAQVKKSQKAIAGVIKEIRKTRGGCAQGLYGKCKDNLLELESVENIILFAYSEMVTKLLEKYGKHHASWKRKLKLFVLECSGKRRLASDNSIEYNDGQYYALQLSKHNFKNIHLLPDTSFGSLVYNFNNKHLFRVHQG